MLSMFFLHILYGTTFTISKILVQYSSPIFIIGIRMVLAGLLLIGIAHFIGKVKIRYDRKTVSYLAQAAVFGIFIPYILRYWSLQYLPVTKTALIYNLGPFVTCIIAYFVFNETLTKKKALGLMLGFSSIIPLFITQTPQEATVEAIGRISWPELAMLCSVTCFSYGWIVVKKLLQHQPISSFALNGRTMLMGGILALGTSLIAEPNHTIAHPWEFASWLALIILITNVICFYLYSKLLTRHSATLLSLGSLLTPVSASITSALYLKEKISADFYISGFLIMTGFFIFYSDELLKQYRHKA